MAHDEYEIEEGREVVRHTIVGGRPMARRKKKLRIPIGLEKTLYLAATDRQFRTSLLDDRNQAVRQAGYDLEESEANILKSVPQSVLTSMIDAIDTKRHTRRRFMRNVAACVLAGSAMIEATGCPGPCTGAEPDPPPQDSVSSDQTDGDEAQSDTETDNVDPDSETIEVDHDIAVTGSMPDDV